MPDKWTGTEDDRLLDLYLFGTSLQQLARDLNRPQHGVKRRIWRLTSGCRSQRYYRPTRKRISREGRPLSIREREIIDSALSKLGQRLYGRSAGKPLPHTERYKAMDVQQIANVLARPLAEIEAYVAARQKPQRKGLFA